MIIIQFHQVALSHSPSLFRCNREKEVQMFAHNTNTFVPAACYTIGCLLHQDLIKIQNGGVLIDFCSSLSITKMLSPTQMDVWS